MLQSLSILVVLALVGGTGLLIVELVRRDADRIVAALVRRPQPVPAARAWPARVRIVSATRPAGFRTSQRHATA